MKIKKAVITAASRAQRTLPLQILVDRDGRQKVVLNIIIEEALRAGVEDIGIVVCPGDEAAYAQAAGDHAGRLSFWAQEEPRGYGHAVYCAREFTKGEPFLHMVGDHVYISGADRDSSTEHSDADSSGRENTGRENANGPERISGRERGGTIERGCARQVVEVACAHACAVSGVQPTREILLPYFGTVGAQRIKGTKELYRIEQVIEKPTPTEAEQSLLVPGLRTGHYLCFFGIHVLTPTVMELLEHRLQQDGTQDRARTQVVSPDAPASGSLSSGASSVVTLPPVLSTSVPASVQLSPVLNELAQREQYLALEMQGLRYPVDAHYGLLTAQLALALSGQDRDEVLVGLCQLLAERQTGTRFSTP